MPVFTKDDPKPATSYWQVAADKPEDLQLELVKYFRLRSASIRTNAAEIPGKHAKNEMLARAIAYTDVAQFVQDLVIVSKLTK